MPYFLYIASALGAVAVWMMMPRHGYSPRKLGAIVGAMTLGALWLYLARHHLPPSDEAGLSQPAMAYFYIFSALAIGAAIRVVTHQKPVYAALWFVMVVLSTAGLLLVLNAEFMAAALVIIYGGAILVTYVFVIMLASQTGNSADAPEYDRVAREPAAAVAVGFLLLAVLLSAAFPTEPQQLLRPNPEARGPSDAFIIEQYLPDRPAQRLKELTDDPQQLRQLAAIESPGALDNTERVGLDLFRKHPLGLELAGVILLVSLVGAVVIARVRTEPPQPPEVSP